MEALRGAEELLTKFGSAGYEYCQAQYRWTEQGDDHCDMKYTANSERRRGPVVGHSLWTRPARVQSPWEARIIRCKNLALYIRDCESLCLSDETVKAVGPFYLVSMPGEVKDPTQGVNV